MIQTIIGYIRRLFTGFRKEILSLPSRTMVFLFCVFLFILPLITTNPYLLGSVMVMIFIFSIYAASWDLLSGFTGQVNFGHAFFLGTSAYTAALLNLKLGLQPLLTIPLGGLVAALAGLIIGIPCLRLRGSYLAIATLTFPIMTIGLIQGFSDFTGGSQGTGVFGTIEPLASSVVNEYFYILIIMLVSVFLIWKITDSKYGMIFHAIREDEVATKASGIGTTEYKLLAFCASAFFAGIAGGLYAHTHYGVGPTVLGLMMSFQAVIYSGFGGMASIYGPVGGVFVLYPLMKLLEIVGGIPPQMPLLIYTALIIVILLFMPEGLFHWIRDQIEIECPRCKKRNSATRDTCRTCGAPLD